MTKKKESEGLEKPLIRFPDTSLVQVVNQDTEQLPSYCIQATSLISSASSFHLKLL